MSGLEFEDDGRAVGTLDWDLDGDLDVWITNRNAPRLRLMRNESQQQNRYVAFLLVGNGTTVNRDAIGARVEIVMQEDASKIRSQTLRAGDAFLSQSSKWLHFGLGRIGPDNAIESVRVVWPDGSTEAFGPLTANRRYRIRQSSGRADLWEPPTRDLALSPAKPALLPRSATARVPLVFPLRVPLLSYHDFNGMERDLPIGKRPILVNLWATWCQPCLDELRELKQRYQEFRNAGLDVVALNVDRLDIGQNRAGKPNLQRAEERIVSELDLPFASGRATKQIVDTFQFLHDLVIHSRQMLPVPTTMLVDADGRLAIVYKGALRVDQVLADIEHSRASFVERKTNAAMIDGTVIEHDLMERVAIRSHGFTLFQAGLAMREVGQIEAAIRYFQDALAVSPKSVPTHIQLGHALKKAGRPDEAASAFRQALRMEPDSAGVHNSLANTLQALGQFAEAVSHYEQAVRIKPDDAAVHSNWAVALEGLGRVEEAVAHYQEAIGIEPNSPQTHRLLGKALLTLNRLHLAQTHLEQAVRLAPDDSDAQSELGKLSVRLGRFEEALTHFESAVRLRPESAAAHINLGNVLKILGRYSHAASEYEKALRIHPDSSATHNNWGATLEAQGRYEEAIAHYRAALEIDPQLAEAHRNWGRAVQQQGKHAEAINHYRKSLQLQPNDPRTLSNLAWLFATCEDDRVRNGQQSVALAERAARLTNYKNPMVLDTLAAAYAELGKFTKATHWQAKAIEMLPNGQKDIRRVRLKRYQSGRPFRQGTRSPSSSPK